MKTLTLYARSIRPEGPPLFHDIFALRSALRTIVRGRAITDCTMWMAIAGRLQEAEDDLPTPLSDNRGQEITVELRNQWARLLWTELCKLPPETFGGVNPLTGRTEVPDLTMVSEMFADIAEQLGETWVLDEDADEE